MIQEWQERGKDERPSRTVEQIKNILGELGVETDHHYMDTDTKSCFSSRVVLRGPLADVIGTNGKGITPEFCLASAYAELLERIQNRAFPYLTHPRDYEQWQAQMGAVGKGVAADIHRISDDIPENGSYVRCMIQQLVETGGFPILYFGEQTVRKLIDNEYLYYPMYDVANRRYVNLPTLFIKLFTHSNGMAAGNTIEEAVVQACSEIIERLAQTEIMENKLSLPDVPNSVIDRYPFVRRIIDEINAGDKYDYYMKDCSLGRGLPVICSIVVDKQNQSLGVRFGCHPSMGIAMERSLTEAFQGRRIENFAATSRITFQHGIVKNRINLLDTKKTGNGWYSPELLMTPPTHPFFDWDAGSAKSNGELAVELVDMLQNSGFPVYIQDVSFLGFPSVFVVAQGASELRQRDLHQAKETALTGRVTAYLLDIKNLTEHKVREIVQLCSIKRNAIMENSIGSMYKLPFSKPFYSANELDFLEFTCQYYLDDHEATARALERCRPVPGEEAFLRAVKLYVSAQYNGYDKAAIREALSTLCDEAVVSRVMGALDEREQVFEKLYPVCNNFRCEQCANSYCRYPAVRQFDEELWRRLADWEGATSAVHRLFE